MVEINQSVHFRELGSTYKVLSESVGGSAAIVEHTLEGKCLGAPMHKHTRENEISYVLEGELSVIQMEKWKLRDKGNILCFIEIITSGNFEYYFAELAPYLLKGQPPQMDKVRETGQKYGLIVDINAASAIIKNTD